MRNFYFSFKTSLLAIFLILVSVALLQAQSLSESFTTEIPSTWKTVNNNSDANFIKTPAQWSIGGTKAYAAAMGCTDDYLITPKLTVSSGDNTLTFKSAVESSTYKYSYKVLVSTTDNSVSSFTDELMNVVDYSTNFWAQTTVDLSAYNGQDIYVAFYVYAAGSSSYSFGFDDITGPAIYVNPNPEISLGVSSHNFGYLAQNSTASYDLTINNTGGSDLTFSAATVSAPFSCPTPSTISAGSSGVVSISFNPTTVGSFSETLTFTSNASAGANTLTLNGNAYSENALIEDFEGTSFPSANWEVTNTSDWSQTSTAGEFYEGSKGAKFYFYGYYTPKLITPKLVVNSSSSVVFYAKRTNSYQTNTIKVQYSTDKSSWTDIGTTATLTTNFTEYSVDLSSLDGNYYLAFTLSSSSTYNATFIDNIILPELYVSADPELTISPASYDFGSLLTNTTGNANLTLTNSGGSDLTVSGLSIASPFSATWSGTIASGASHDITVSVNSATAGLFTETLTVSSDAAAGNNTIDLTAEFVDAENLPYAEGFNGTVPSNWSVGSWMLTATTPYEGTHSIYTYDPGASLTSPWIDLTGTAPRLVMQWKNAVSKNLKVEITEDGSSFTQMFYNVPSGTNWEELVLDLTAYVNKTVQLRFTSDANQAWNSVFIDDLKIEEAPTDPVYAFSRTEFAFGTVLLSESPMLSASITNAGVSTVDIDAISISGTDAGEFSLSTLTLPVSIDNAGSLDFYVEFSPASEGPKTATLSIVENNGTTHTYTITGTGFDAEIKTLPFSENFDAVSIPALPAGWDKKIKAGSASAVVETSTLYSNSAPNSLKMYGAYSVDSLTLIFPNSSINLATTVLNFSLYPTSTGEMAVGYMTDKTNLNTFVKVSTINFSGYSRKACEVKFSDVVLSGNYYLAILVPAKGVTVQIDDIVWSADEQAPIANFNPVDAATGVNPYASISISFDEKVYANGGAELANDDLASMLILKDTDASGTDVPFAASIANNVISITPDSKLAYSTDYYIELKANSIQDRAGNLNTLATATFTVMDEPFIATTPFSQSFEGTAFPPANWSVLRTKWARYNGTDVTIPEGTATAKYTNYSFSNGDSASLITPVIDLSSLNEPNLVFQYHNLGGTFRVEASYNMGISYQTLFSTSTVTADFTQEAIKLATGKENVMLKFFAKNANFTSSYIYLDTIFLDETPADPIFDITFTSHDFGTILLNASATETIIVANTGGQKISIQSVDLTGSDAVDFNISALSLPIELTTNTLQIDITFQPLSGGAKSAALVIEEEDGTQHSVTLSGVGFDSEIKSLPFTENFDATIDGEITLGWSNIINTGSTSAYAEVRYGTSANSAPNELRIYGGKADGTVMAVLPFTNLDLTNAKLKLVGRGSAGCYLIVGTLSDKTDEATFTEVDTLYINEGINKAYEADLSGITETGPYFIGLKHGYPNSFFPIYIDDLRITNNVTPQITSTPITEIHAGHLYSYSITASDENGDALTFTHTYKPDWLTLTDNGDGTALLSGTPTETGYNSVTIIASDGADQTSQSFTISVSNVAPAFTSVPLTTAIAGEVYFYQVSATDTDGDALTFTAELKPDWLTFTDNGDGTAELTGTPTTANTDNVSIKVTDGFDERFQNFSILVEEPNQIPVFTSSPVNEVITGQSYTYAITATDGDDEALTFSTVSIPTWLTLTDNGNGTATLTGTAGAVGDYNVTIQVTDGEAVVEQSFTLTVNQVPNTAPTFTSLPITKVTAATTYSYNITCSDVDSDPLSITATLKPDWLSLTDNGDGTALLTGTAGDAGNYNITLEVADGEDTTQQQFVLEVSVLPNTDPVFTSTPVIDVVQGNLYTYNITATDSDADLLQFTAPTKPTWLALTDNGDGTAVLTGTPTDFGNFNVVIRLTDGAVNIDQNFTIIVSEPTNTAPVFTSVPETNAKVGQEYSYLVQTNDVDDDEITLAVLTKPEWLIFNTAKSNGFLSGTPNQAGEYNISILATDLKDTTYQNWIITVEAAENQIPEFITQAPLTVVAGQSYLYRMQAADADSDELTYNADTLPDWLSFAAYSDGTAAIFGNPLYVGNYDVTLSVTDGKDTVFQDFVIVVEPATNTAPEFTSIPDTLGTVNEYYTYNIVVADAENNELSIWAEALPEWLSLTDVGDGTAQLSGIPVDAAVYNVTLLASDAVDTTMQQFSIGVLPNDIKDRLGFDVLVYPNPAKENIQIRSNRPCNLFVLTSTGSVIWKKTDKDFIPTLNVSGLEPGQYLLKAVFEEQIVIHKFIILK